MCIRDRDRVEVCFELGSRPPVCIGSRVLGDREELLVEERVAPPEKGARMIRIRVPVSRLLGLAERLDLRPLANDALTLSWRARRFKLSWIPSFLANLMTVSGALLATLGRSLFSLRRP